MFCLFLLHEIHVTSVEGGLAPLALPAPGTWPAELVPPGAPSWHLAQQVWGLLARTPWCVSAKPSVPFFIISKTFNEISHKPMIYEF